MPNLDGTGPVGRGAGTGRGMGNCQNTDRKNCPPNQRPAFKDMQADEFVYQKNRQGRGRNRDIK